MKKYIFAHPALLTFTVLLGIATQGISAATSFFLMFIIDSITAGDMSSLIESALYGIGFVALFFCLLFAYTKITVFYSYKTVVRLKNDMFTAILNTSISDFSQSNSAKYISVINNDIQMINDKFLSGVLAVTKDISTLFIALGAMAYLSPLNALIALVLSSSPMLLPIIFGRNLSSTNLKYVQNLSKLNEKVKDFLQGFEVIKTFGIERSIASKFSQSVFSAEKSRYDANKASSTVGSISGTSMVATQLVTYLIAGYFVITGEITIGAVIAIAGLSSTVMHPINLMSINFANIKSTKDVRARLLEVMKPIDTINRVRVADFNSGIYVKNLSFKYDTPTESLEIVGGKKPIIKMIPLDGRSIEEALASIGIKDTDNIKLLDAAETDPEMIERMINPIEKKSADSVGAVNAGINVINQKSEIPLTDNGEPDIAAILAEHGLTHIDVSQVQVIHTSSIDAATLDNTPHAEMKEKMARDTLDAQLSSAFSGETLKNISYEFKPGGKYAVVGSSGSGKSTLLKLLMGYYDNYSGEVLVGDAEIRDINRESLYQRLSVMHQNVFLLDDTLRNNITLDSPYSDDAFSLAIEKAQLDKVVKQLPKGMDTRVGEGGNTLSGGERQRVAIARALIKGCDVMLLDEAMANLDNETAYSIEKSLIETQGITCIFVTHRYTEELLNQCDGILVMHNGQLIENGTFAELYAKKEYFYSLYNLCGR